MTQPEMTAEQREQSIREWIAYGVSREIAQLFVDTFGDERPNF